ncbi:UvrD-helicase domain-containing protein [Desulfobacterota bacterium AH_259_B03_O07]|nr:UvrD-helicase domain-containing protein [Desulfobacterota bacterium AH_259_B03_O07]
MKSRIEEFMNLNDEQGVALELSRDIVVEAGAGSGKTRALVARYLKILEEGRANVDGIVAITFTENAASEMRERISCVINEYIEQFGECNFINKEAIKRLPNAPISTIHGFAARILKENPFESLLPPNFLIIEGVEQRLFIEETIDDFIVKVWETQIEPDNEILLSVLSEESYDLKKVRDRLFSIISLANMLHLDLEHQCEVFSNGRTISFDENDLLSALIQKIQTDLPDSTNIYVQRRIDSVRTNSSYLLNRDIKAIRSIALSEIKNDLDVKNGILGLKRASEGDKAIASLLLDLVNSILDLYDSDLTEIYLKLAREAYGFVNIKKANAGYLEYEDLLAICRKSLHRNHSLLRHYRRKFRFIMVDEFQDTDSLQFEVIKLLSQNGGANTFIVGDPKQSIFRFRGGDLDVFTNIKKNADKIDKFLTNYRSHESLIEFYNRFFEKLLQGNYEAMEAFCEANKNERYIEFIFSFDRAASVWRKKEASSVLKKIVQLHDQGYDYKDISVICRSTSNMYMLENELRKYRIPYYSSSIGGFFGQQEIRDITVFIKYLQDPSDKISEACVLRSLFLGASDDELLAHYTNQTTVESIEEYLSFISGLRNEILSLTPLAILEFILEKTCYDAALLALPEGVVKYANVKKLINIFGRLEALGYGIGQVLEYIDTNLMEDSEPLAQVELEKEDSVKILTVHKAKGLEFPVVILTDLNHGPGGGNESVIARRDSGFLVRYEGGDSHLWESISDLESRDNLEEEKRSLYVANTRAKELLIVSFGGQIKKDGKIKINESSFAGFFESVFDISANFKRESIDTLGFNIPIWKPGNLTISKEEDEEARGKEVEIDMIIERFPIDNTYGFASGEGEEHPTIEKLGEEPSELEIGRFFHRFLQIWDFKPESISSTARFVLNEGFIINDSLEKKLIKLGEDFLHSEFIERINRADGIEREVPFFMEIDGSPERRKIDLILRERGDRSLFDYKYKEDNKLKDEVMAQYKSQLDLYANAIEQKFGEAPKEKVLITLPEIDLIEI